MCALSSVGVHMHKAAALSALKLAQRSREPLVLPSVSVFKWARATLCLNVWRDCQKPGQKGADPNMELRVFVVSPLTCSSAALFQPADLWSWLLSHCASQPSGLASNQHPNWLCQGLARLWRACRPMRQAQWPLGPDRLRMSLMNNERGEVIESSPDSLEPICRSRRRTVQGGRQSARWIVYFINIHGGRRKDKCPSLPDESERKQERNPDLCQTFCL